MTLLAPGWMFAATGVKMPACLPAWPPPDRGSCGVSVPIEDIWRYVQSVLNYRECGRGNAAADVLTSELCGFIPTPAQVHSVELSHS